MSQTQVITEEEGTQQTLLIPAISRKDDDSDEDGQDRMHVDDEDDEEESPSVVESPNRARKGMKSISHHNIVTGNRLGARKGKGKGFYGKGHYGKGKGKGMGKGKYAVRHRRKRPLRDNIMGITKPAIRRLARRGGVKRISKETYDETREVLRSWLTDVVRIAVTYTDHRKRKTVTSGDVFNALKQCKGKTLYGFGQ